MNRGLLSPSSSVFLQRKNIGEVARSDGGVNLIERLENVGKESSVSIRKYRGSARRTRELKQKAHKFQEQTLRRKFNHAINQRWQDHTFA